MKKLKENYEPFEMDFDTAENDHSAPKYQNRPFRTVKRRKYHVKSLWQCQARNLYSVRLK